MVLPLQRSVKMLWWASTGVKNGMWELCFSPSHIKKGKISVDFACCEGGFREGKLGHEGPFAHSGLTPAGHHLWVITASQPTARFSSEHCHLQAPPWKGTSQINYVLPNLESIHPCGLWKREETGSHKFCPLFNLPFCMGEPRSITAVGSLQYQSGL